MHKGRTIHLLKQGSKSSMQERKRRKISVANTPQEWKHAQRLNQDPQQLVNQL